MSINPYYLDNDMIPKNRSSNKYIKITTTSNNQTFLVFFCFFFFCFQFSSFYGFLYEPNISKQKEQSLKAQVSKILRAINFIKDHLTPTNAIKFKKLRIRGKNKNKNLENKAFPNPPSGMIGRVLLLSQVPSSHKRNSHGVAKYHLDRSGSDRRQIEGTQLPLQRQMHIHVASVGQGIVRNGGNRNEINPLGSGTGKETKEFFSRAGFRKEDENVGGGECANVAVESVERGEERGADV